MNSARESGNMKSALQIILFFHALLLTLYCSLFTVSAAEAVVVSEVEIKGLHSIGKDELLYLLDMRPGETIDADSVRLGIKRAFLKGIFEDISVETTGGEKAKVTINIRERNFIKDICIEGNYDISKKTIRELFLLKEDQVLPCDILDKAVEELKPRIAALGYPNAEIHAEIVRLKEQSQRFQPFGQSFIFALLQKLAHHLAELPASLRFDAGIKLRHQFNAGFFFSHL
jgi:outer membrane protein assembly factor BamA